MSQLPFNEAEEARFAATEAVASAALPAAGGTVSGDLTLNGTNLTITSASVNFSAIPTASTGNAGDLINVANVLSLDSGA